MNTPRVCGLWPTLLLLVSALWLVPTNANAMCGTFFSSGSSSSGKLFNDESTVVLMRDGERTVLSMRNHYNGPAQDFAMIVPVPEVFKPGQVKVIEDEVFETLDRQTAPELVEYWQWADCRYTGTAKFSNVDFSPTERVSGPEAKAFASTSTVTVQAEFNVNEYNIAILSAKESSALASWLMANGFFVSREAHEVIESYIARGMYFFVAKVDARKITFDSKGNAMLSPLRFHYDSKDFALPIRLGLLNSRGQQDLIIYILSKEGRYETANYRTITIPTNLVVPHWVGSRFKDFYEAVFAYTKKLDPDALVTEYVGEVRLGPSDVDSLGGETLPEGISKPEGDVSVNEIYSESSGLRSKLHQAMYHEISGMRACLHKALSRAKQGQFVSGKGVFLVSIDEKGKVKDVVIDEGDIYNDEDLARCSTAVVSKLSITPVRGAKNPRAKLVFDYKISMSESKVSLYGWTLTRLHARYSAKEAGEDLIFRKAPALSGGWGEPTGSKGTFDPYYKNAVYSDSNQFRARYVMLHPWKSKKGLKDWVCKSTGDWGTRNSRHRSFGAAPEAALAPRGEITLSKSLQRDVRAQKKVLKLEKPEEKDPKGRRRQDDQVLDGW
ncbi:MAG: DUF2330 domain-containing protein [Myxococcota bacterium]|nr:DUF2330 domain-containing protein [Myxococcota bacterium]